VKRPNRIIMDLTVSIDIDLILAALQIFQTRSYGNQDLCINHLQA
jgi:hypothetical protein